MRGLFPDIPENAVRALLAATDYTAGQLDFAFKAGQGYRLDSIERLTRPDGEVITGGSAFNIKAESIRLGDFSRSEMEALYAQHTAATGQRFTPEALELAWTSPSTSSTSLPGPR